jgi:hypothetical protein
MRFYFHQKAETEFDKAVEGFLSAIDRMEMKEYA